MLTSLATPLSEEELDWLDAFLLDRIDEDTVYEDDLEKNEGVLDISELDGFFTALVSGPEVILPSRWLPAVWGDYAPEWENQKYFEAVFSLLIRHMNGIAATLMEQPEDFEPLFLERVVEDKTYAVVDEWCEGYVRGMKLAEEAWASGGPEMRVLLMPILAFTNETDWKAHDLTDVEIGDLHVAITRNVREIHAYWLHDARRRCPPNSRFGARRPAVGRNDPCPCGSGKKYKKCCLH